jgi:hypothetical protein
MATQAPNVEEAALAFLSKARADLAHAEERLEKATRGVAMATGFVGALRLLNTAAAPWEAGFCQWLNTPEGVPHVVVAMNHPDEDANEEGLDLPEKLAFKEAISCSEWALDNAYFDWGNFLVALVVPEAARAALDLVVIEDARALLDGEGAKS